MTKRQFLKVSVLCVLTSMCTVSSFAVDNNTAKEQSDVYMLPEVLVTAQRTETKTLETPSSTTVLTEKDIKKTGANSVFDAISFATGITNFSYGAGGLDYGAMDSRINVRGLERGATVLLNGAPITLNGKNTISGIPMHNVERIEIVRGAASALYGAEALSGVINIITKNSKETGGSASVGLGNLGHKEYSINYNYNGFGLGISKEFFGDIDRTSPDRLDREYYNSRYKGDTFNINMNAKIDERFSVNFLRTETNSSYGQISFKANPIARKKGSSIYKYNDVKNYASFIYDHDNTKVTTFYNDRKLFGQQRTFAVSKFRTNDSNFTTKKYGIDAQHTWKFADEDYLIGGILVSKDIYKGDSVQNADVTASRTNYAVYGSYKHDFSNRFSSTLGLRYQHIADPVKDQDIFIPQWQTLYKLNDSSSIYTNIGRSFTMPNLSDTFRKVSGSSAYKPVSGKNLKPEEGWNYEIGYKRITNKDEWKIALFYMDFKNFFEWKKDPTAPLQYTRVNGGKFKNTGIEIDYKHKFNPQLAATLGVSYSNPRSLGINATEWKQTFPKFQLNAGLAYESKKWEASMRLNYLTKRLKNRDGGINPDLINLNVQGGYHFNDSNSIYVSFNNILNRHNVISNGNWEYWDLPFNYTVRYEYKF